ncbi:DUF2079 domain-containing protein [Candidatus Roizmanbacteria bacterium]|nr:DUF2079 domain-containing protein [Candidatus Roizmanbacteria bacterium]
MQQRQGYFKRRTLILLITFLYTLVVGIVVLNRFWQFEVFYYDQGLYDRSIWLVSRLQTPIIEHQGLGRVHQFADHFIPSVFLLFSPLYWVTSRYDITLIALSVYTGLSVLIGFEIARGLIKNRIMIYALLGAYMGYVGLQNALIFYIHPITAVLLPLQLLFLTLFRQQWRLFFPLLIMVLGFQETLAPLGVAIGLFMLLYRREWWKQALFVIIISLVYGYVATRIVMPSFSDKPYLYQPEWPVAREDYVKRFIDDPRKIDVIQYSLATFGWLPLFAPATWPFLLQDLFLRFVVSGGPPRWDLGLHYNAPLAVLLFVSAVLGYRFLEKRRWAGTKTSVLWSLGIVGIVLYLHQFVLHGPFALAYNPEFYRHTGRQGFMHEFLRAVPKEGVVMTQNNLAVFFTHEKDVHIINHYADILTIQPDLVVIDLRPGQNPNNFWPSTEGKLREAVSFLQTNSDYTEKYNKEDRYIFVYTSKINESTP